MNMLHKLSTLSEFTILAQLKRLSEKLCVILRLKCVPKTGLTSEIREQKFAQFVAELNGE